jgi:hypothetical protein
MEDNMEKEKCIQRMGCILLVNSNQEVQNATTDCLYFQMDLFIKEHSNRTNFRDKATFSMLIMKWNIKEVGTRISLMVMGHNPIKTGVSMKDNLKKERNQVKAHLHGLMEKYIKVNSVKV